MARKPVHLQPAGSLTPRDRIWTEIRKQRQFTFKSIEDKTRISEETTRTYIDCLLAAGIVEIAQEHVLGRLKGGGYVPHTFRLVKDGGISTPRFRANGEPVTQGNAQQHLWQAMRVIGEFDWRSLLLSAATEELPIPPATVKAYLKALVRAEYVQIVRPGAARIPARYRLRRNTGPKAPMVQAIKQVWDPNLGKIVWAPKPEEVADEQA